MKKIITLLLFFSFFISASSQNIAKFRTQDIAVKLLDDNGNWGEWSDWEDSSSLITHNLDDERITIYGNPNRTFDIVSIKEANDDNGNTGILMNCIGYNEQECTFKMTFDRNKNIQFYIYYSEAIMVYNVKRLD